MILSSWYKFQWVLVLIARPWLIEDVITNNVFIFCEKFRNGVPISSKSIHYGTVSEKLSKDGSSFRTGVELIESMLFALRN